MNKLLAVFAVATAALFGVAAVAPASAQDDDARVRVVHASPDAPAVDVYVDGSAVLTDVPFPTASDYLPVAAGTYNVQVFAAGSDPEADSPVIEADLTLDAGTDYTVVAVGLLEDIGAEVFVDDNSAPAAGQAHVRVIHASPDAPAVDIGVADGPVLFSNLAFRELQGPAPVDAGTYDLQILAAGTDTVALPLDGVTLDEGLIYTVIAVGLLEGEPALDVLTIVDEPRVPAEPPVDEPPVVETPVTVPDTGTGTGMTEGTSGWILAALVMAAAAVAATGLGFAFRRAR
jgi:hypothetical protein